MNLFSKALNNLFSVIFLRKLEWVLMRLSSPLSQFKFAPQHRIGFLVHTITEFWRTASFLRRLELKIERRKYQCVGIYDNCVLKIWYCARDEPTNWRQLHQEKQWKNIIGRRSQFQLVLLLEFRLQYRVAIGMPKQLVYQYQSQPLSSFQTHPMGDGANKLSRGVLPVT